MVRHDAIVVGLGAMGSAAAWQLARRGARVLGIDRHAPPHALGSSHGETRITRLATGEGDHLTPLVLRAHEIWREVERETGAKLLTANGGLILSSRARTSFTHVEGFFANTVAAAEKNGIAHELLDSNAIHKRFPKFRVRDDEVGYFEPSAGFLRPEACIGAELELARRQGADLRTNERALRIDEAADGVRVETDAGSYLADRLVICAGPWLPSLIETPVAQFFRVFRQVLYWFAVDEPVEDFTPERFPVFIWELQNLRQGIYGFPAVAGSAGGLKIATESYAEATSPQRAVRTVGDDEIASMYAQFVAPQFRNIGARCVKTAVCLYTVTPDFGFVIDWLPGSKRVLIVSPCSGHGFKHSATVGEIAADLIVSGKTRFETAAFRFARFNASK